MRARHSSLIAMSNNKGMGLERRSSVGANSEEKSLDFAEQRVAN